MHRFVILAALAAGAWVSAAAPALADMDCEPLDVKGFRYLDCNTYPDGKLCYRCPPGTSPGGALRDCQEIVCSNLPQRRY